MRTERGNRDAHRSTIAVPAPGYVQRWPCELSSLREESQNTVAHIVAHFYGNIWITVHIYS
jgi:hypothetical protein